MVSFPPLLSPTCAAARNGWGGVATAWLQNKSTTRTRQAAPRRGACAQAHIPGLLLAKSQFDGQWPCCWSCRRCRRCCRRRHCLSCHRSSCSCRSPPSSSTTTSTSTTSTTRMASALQPVLLPSAQPALLCLHKVTCIVYAAYVRQVLSLEGSNDDGSSSDGLDGCSNDGSWSSDCSGSSGGSDCAAVAAVAAADGRESKTDAL